MPKQPSEMALIEAIQAISDFNTEHDLDCEEGVGSDRCTPCLAKAALERLSTLPDAVVSDFNQRIDLSTRQITYDYLNKPLRNAIQEQVGGEQ